MVHAIGSDADVVFHELGLGAFAKLSLMVQPY